MVKGIGVDIVEIQRIEEAMRNPRFLEEYFSAREQELFAQRHHSANCVAANFAAKEAFAKALGLGIRGFRISQVEVLRNAIGMPYLALSGKAQELADQLGTSCFFVSLSHSKTDAIAFVVAQS